MTIYQCKHFNLYELVDNEVYMKYGNAGWQFLDVGLLKTLDALRDKFGSITVNDWRWGGEFSQRGLRDFNYGGTSNRSLHKMGKAVDMVFKHVSVDEVREYILANQHEFPYINSIELGTSWLHIDVRNRRNEKGEIFTFHP